MRLLEKWDKEIELITAHPECTNGWEKDFVFDMEKIVSRNEEMSKTTNYGWVS